MSSTGPLMWLTATAPAEPGARNGRLAETPTSTAVHGGAPCARIRTPGVGTGSDAVAAGL